VDGDNFSTFRHTFFVFFDLAGVAGGCSGWVVALPTPRAAQHYPALCVMLFFCLRFEHQVLLPDAESDLSDSNINPCLDIIEEWSPKNKQNPTIIFHIKDQEICEDVRTLDIHQ
jgi:hypothetical protein